MGTLPAFKPANAAFGHSYTANGNGWNFFDTDYPFAIASGASPGAGAQLVTADIRIPRDMTLHAIAVLVKTQFGALTLGGGAEHEIFLYANFNYVTPLFDSGPIDATSGLSGQNVYVPRIITIPNGLKVTAGTVINLQYSMGAQCATGWIETRGANIALYYLNKGKLGRVLAFPSQVGSLIAVGDTTNYWSSVLTDLDTGAPVPGKPLTNRTSLDGSTWTGISTGNTDSNGAVFFQPVKSESLIGTEYFGETFPGDTGSPDFTGWPATDPAPFYEPVSGATPITTELRIPVLKILSKVISVIRGTSAVITGQMYDPKVPSLSLSGRTLGFVVDGAASGLTAVTDANGNYALNWTPQSVLNTAFAGDGVSSPDGRLYAATASPLLTITVVDLLTLGIIANRLTGIIPLLINFTATVAGGVTPYTIIWDFGDGSPKVTGLTASHTFSLIGSYTVTCTAADNETPAQSITKTLTLVTIPSLSLAIGANLLSGIIPLVTNFTTAAAGGVPPYTFAWDFGDGSLGTGATPSHTFSLVGTYTVKCTATDSASNTALATLHIQALNITPPLTIIAVGTPLTGTPPLSVSFLATPGGGSPPYAFSWTFGDGTMDTTQNPAHTYTAVGTYNAFVTVRDSLGAVATSTQIPIVVHTGIINPPPTQKPPPFFPEICAFLTRLGLPCPSQTFRQIIGRGESSG